MNSRYFSTAIEGIYEIQNDSYKDNRGVFTNAFRKQDPAYIKTWGERSIKQINLSLRHSIGNICGLHIQNSPKGEAKLIRCLQGRIWDVAVDLRPHSDTFGEWTAIELSPELCNAILIPEGCAHGFQVLEPHSKLLYLHSGKWVPEAETGVLWEDPQLAIPWPLDVTDLSARDRSLPLLANLKNLSELAP